MKNCLLVSLDSGVTSHVAMQQRVLGNLRPLEAWENLTIEIILSKEVKREKREITLILSNNIELTFNKFCLSDPDVIQSEKHIASKSF